VERECTPTTAIFARTMATTTLEFLGTGTSQGVPVVACSCHVCRSIDPRDKRLRTSALLRTKGRTLLIDAGPDLRQQMLRCGLDDLDAVLLTHEHMDHVAGIDELRALNFHLRRPMDIHANTATLEAVRRMFHYAFAKNKYPGVPELRLHAITADTFQAAGVPVMPVEVLHHFLPVTAFRIGGLAYVTDAKTIEPAELDKLRGADVLVLNALRKKEHISHLDLDAALAMVRELKPREAWFTHISHLMGTHAEVSAELPHGVGLAYDGLRVEVRDG
jgi:phosphoribosyl 1,2-cyclic phosphate phosphodiesterase